MRPRFFINLEPTRASSSDTLESTPDLLGDEITLSVDDSHHGLRVLRLTVGDPCEVVVTVYRQLAEEDVEGQPVCSRSVEPQAAVYAAIVTAAAGRLKVRLVSLLEGDKAGAGYSIQIGVVQALTRPNVIDYLLEKSTEVGASFFLLMPTAGSPRWSGASQTDRLKRWRRIAEEAAKQSKQIMVPQVEMVSSLDEALSHLRTRQVLSLVLEPGAQRGLYETVLSATADGWVDGSARVAQQPTRLGLWIGPESGWTAEELCWFSAAGLETSRLGRGVLRAETAGPVAVAVARLALNDW